MVTRYFPDIYDGHIAAKNTFPHGNKMTTVTGDLQNEFIDLKK